MFPSKHSRVAIAIRENTLLPANVRRIYSPPAPLTGRGRALKHEPVPGRRPHRTCERNNSARRFGSGPEGCWTTPSRVVPVLLLDANGHISQTTWPDQIGKYSSKKTTFNGQCLGELLQDHHLQAANTYFPVGATFFGPFTNTQIDFACLPAAVHVHRCCALHHDGDR